MQEHALLQSYERTQEQLRRCREETRAAKELYDRARSAEQQARIVADQVKEEINLALYSIGVRTARPLDTAEPEVKQANGIAVSSDIIDAALEHVPTPSPEGYVETARQRAPHPPPQTDVPTIGAPSAPQQTLLELMPLDRPVSCEDLLEASPIHDSLASVRSMLWKLGNKGLVIKAGKKRYELTRAGRLLMERLRTNPPGFTPLRRSPSTSSNEDRV